MVDSLPPVCINKITHAVISRPPNFKSLASRSSFLALKRTAYEDFMILMVNSTPAHIPLTRPKRGCGISLATALKDKKTSLLNHFLYSLRFIFLSFYFLMCEKRIVMSVLWVSPTLSSIWHRWEFSEPVLHGWVNQWTNEVNVRTSVRNAWNPVCLKERL